MRDLIRVPSSEESRLLGQSVVIGDTDRAARLELLRAFETRSKTG
jgi:hypothetical protein